MSSDGLPGWDPGDEAQIVVFAAPLPAQLVPAADVAVFDRRWVRADRRVRRRRRRDLLLEPATGQAVVGHVVADPEVFDGSGAAAEGHVHPLGLEALDRRQRGVIRADLEQGAAFCAPGELRVGDLVAPRAESARLLDAEQEVGEAEPSTVEECRLVDDVVASTDRLDRCCGGAAVLLAAVLDRLVGVDLGDLATLSGQVGEEPLLVLDPSLLDQIELRIGPDRPMDELAAPASSSACQVLAGEEPDEVGRREDGVAVDQLHWSPASVKLHGEQAVRDSITPLGHSRHQSAEEWIRRIDPARHWTCPNSRIEGTARSLAPCTR